MCKVEKFEEPTPYILNQRPIYYVINDNGCFICVSHRRDRDGYAKLMRKNKEWKAHRFTYTICKGEIPNGLIIRHLCNNKSCINPEHLVVGTAKQNYADWLATNQQRKAPHLLPEEVKREVALSMKTIPILADENNVSNTTIINIRKKYRKIDETKRVKENSSIRRENEGIKKEKVKYVIKQTYSLVS